MPEEKQKQDIRKFHRNEFVQTRKENTPNQVHYQSSPLLSSNHNSSSQASSWPDLEHSQNLSSSPENNQHGIHPNSVNPNIQTDKDCEYTESSNIEPTIMSLYKMIVDLQKQVEKIEKRTQPTNNIPKAQTTSDNPVVLKNSGDAEQLSADNEKNKCHDRQTSRDNMTAENLTLNDIFYLVSNLQKQIQSIDERTKISNQLTKQT